MPFGRLNTQQREALKPHVLASIVHDLGAGDLSLAGDLVRLGAQQVVAIDKEPYRRRPGPGINTVTCYFENYPGLVDTSFVSWPKNTFDMGLLNLVRRSRIVAYLGTNTGGTACGFTQMWHHLSNREVIEHVPDEFNTLIIYGPSQQRRKYLPEEYAGIFTDRMWLYRDIHAIADSLPVVGISSSYGN